MKTPLNPPQVQAVRHVDGPLLVLAGAGSGKTRVITHKIAWLVRECGHAPGNIGAVTFTNKAAREMKSRVAALLGPRDGRGLMVSTFHSLGLRILQRDHAHLGYRSGFSIFDAEDARGVMRELLRSAGTDADQDGERLQWRISAWKSDMVSPEQAISKAADDTEHHQALLYAEYQRHLQAYNAFDFDDLIVRPVQLLAEQPDVREYWQNRLRYLLVDEYQDTNTSQYDLLRQLTGVRARFTVVGDDDQSIYAWRGARPENLHRLSEDYPTLRVIKLEQNYRSTARILRSANALIAGNPHLFDKQLWSTLGDGDPLRVIRSRDADTEVTRIAGEIIQHRFHKRTAFSDYAILYRGNHQARPFEKALREHQIPYRINGGNSFFDKAEIKDLMAYLRLLVNPDDNSAFLRIINTPRRQIGASTLEKLGAYAGQRDISLVAACGEMGLGEYLAERNLQRVREFSQWLDDMTRMAAREPVANVARRVLHETDYEAWLLETSRDPVRTEKRMASLAELVEWLGKLAAREEMDGRLDRVLAHLSLMGILDRQADDDGGDQVQLMTLHAAKGLEFDHVFMVGMEEGLLPHQASIDAETIEEERRLCYVGITRARRSLTLSWAAHRRRAGDTVECEPSRFLAELPTADVVWEDPTRPVDPEVRAAKGRAHLATLRDLLAND